MFLNQRSASEARHCPTAPIHRQAAGNLQKVSATAVKAPPHILLGHVMTSKAHAQLTVAPPPACRSRSRCGAKESVAALLGLADQRQVGAATPGGLDGEARARPHQRASFLQQSPCSKRAQRRIERRRPRAISSAFKKRIKPSRGSNSRASVSSRAIAAADDAWDSCAHACSKQRDDLSEDGCRGLLRALRVKGIAQAVAEEIEGERLAVMQNAGKSTKPPFAVERVDDLGAVFEQGCRGSRRDLRCRA